MKIEELLNQSIDALERGSGVEAELDRYDMADHAAVGAELEPLLHLAQRLRQTKRREDAAGPAMQKAQLDRSLQRLHERLGTGTNGQIPTNGHALNGHTLIVESNGHHNGTVPQNPARTPDLVPVMSLEKTRQKKTLLEKYTSLALHPALRAAVVIVALLLAGMGMTVASADSLPNTPLYSIKRTTEQIQSQIVSGPAATRWHLELADRRLYEIQTLARLGKNVESDLVGEMQDEYRTAIAMAERNHDATTHRDITQHLEQARQVLTNLTPQVPEPSRPMISTALDELRQEQEKLDEGKRAPAGGTLPPGSDLTGSDLSAMPTAKGTATVLKEEIQVVPATPAPAEYSQHATLTPSQEPERFRIAPLSGTQPAESTPAPAATETREGIPRDQRATPEPTGTFHPETEQHKENRATATPQPAASPPYRPLPGITPTPEGSETPHPVELSATPQPTREHREEPLPTQTPHPRRDGPPPSPTYVIRRESPSPTPEPRRERPSATATPEPRRERPSPTPTHRDDNLPRWEPTAITGNIPAAPTATPEYRREHPDPTPSPGGP
ncbi:MAG: hypothetical protein EXR62_09135 [Chloroflexi bacterium]|nr:hypothetical protein [Chloroflexota bacterium]